MRYWIKSSVYFLWFYSEGLAIQVNMLITNILVWRGVHEVRIVERGLKKGKNVVATRYRGSVHVLSKDSFGGFVGYIYTFCHC